MNLLTLRETFFDPDFIKTYAEELTVYNNTIEDALYSTEDLPLEYIEALNRILLEEFQFSTQLKNIATMSIQLKDNLTYKEDK